MSKTKTHRPSIKSLERENAKLRSELETVREAMGTFSGLALDLAGRLGYTPEVIAKAMLKSKDIPQHAKQTLRRALRTAA